MTRTTSRFDQAFGLGRIFHLVTDGHLHAPFDDAGNIALDGPVRHAAHGNRRRLVFVPGCQRDFKDFGGRLRILEKHFIEVAHSIEKKCIRILGLDSQILLDHGGGFYLHKFKLSGRKAVFRRHFHSTFVLLRMLREPQWHIFNRLPARPRGPAPDRPRHPIYLL